MHFFGHRIHNRRFHSSRERLGRRDRRLEPAGGLIHRPFRAVTFRSFPIRLEDHRLAPHGICDTVARPVYRPGRWSPQGPYATLTPRRERRQALAPRLRGPSHRPRL